MMERGATTGTADSAEDTRKPDEERDAMAGPLHGLRVIEMVGLGPAPFCGMVLADLGADVLRVDRPSPTPGKAAATASVVPSDPRFDVLARGRPRLSLDLKSPEGRACALDLIADADVVIEGFRPGTMERLGLGPEPCLARNPTLVYGRMTGWGQDGPLSQAAGHDLNYIAISGALHAIGRAGDKPAVPANYIGDFGGGAMLLAVGVMAALFERSRSGRGQVVDAAMTDGAALLSAMMYGFAARGWWNTERGTNMLDGGAHFYDTYRCADGRFVAVGAIEPQFYATLRERLDLLDDPDFDAQMDPSRWPALRDRLAALFATKARDAWCEILEGSDACFAPVLDWNEAPAHHHNVARRTFLTVDGVVQPAPAPRFDRTPADAPTPRAAIEADPVTLLAEHGIARERAEALRRGGIVGA